MAQHAAGFGVGLRRLELERRTVECFRHRRGRGKGGTQPVRTGRHGHAVFQKLAAAPPRTDAIWAGHAISPLWLFSRLSTLPSNSLPPPPCRILPRSPSHAISSSITSELLTSSALDSSGVNVTNCPRPYSYPLTTSDFSISSPVLGSWGRIVVRVAAAR